MDTPGIFVSNATALTRKLGEWETKQVPRATISIPYTAGVSEEIRKVCWDYDVSVEFKTSRTLCSKLTRSWVAEAVVDWGSRLQAQNTSKKIFAH